MSAPRMNALPRELSASKALLPILAFSRGCANSPAYPAFLSGQFIPRVGSA